MTAIAEAYVHLKRFYVPEEQLRVLGDFAVNIAADAALRTYGLELTIEVALERGSIKVWAKVSKLGKITTAVGVIWTGIATYPDLKDGLSQLTDDAKHYAEKFIDAFTSHSVQDPEQVYRTERRTKAVGRLLRAINELEELEKNLSSYSPDTLKEKLESVRSKFLRVKSELDRADAAFVFDILRNEHKKRLPPELFERVGLVERTRNDQMQPGYTVSTSIDHLPRFDYHRAIRISGDGHRIELDLREMDPRLLGFDQKPD